MWLTSRLGLFGERILLRVGVGSAGSEAGGVGMSFQLSMGASHFDGWFDRRQKYRFSHQHNLTAERRKSSWGKFIAMSS
jgi:hypothetical protein